MQRPLPVGLIVGLLAVAAVVGAGVAAPLGATHPDVTADQSPAGTSAAGEPLLSAQEFESAQFTITVSPNGDGRWVFRYTRPLENDSEREQFQEYAERFNNQNTELYTDFRNRSQRLVDRGARVTGRNMSASNYTKEAYLGGLGAQGTLGVVEMRFTWSGFGLVSADRVAVGDVFEGGLYIGQDQQLRFVADPTLNFETVEPQPTNISGQTLAGSNSVGWVGEREFGPSRPRLVLVDENASTGPGQTTGGAATAGDAGTPTMLILGFVIVVLGLTGALAWRSGGLDGLLPDRDDGGAGAAAEPASETGVQPTTPDADAAAADAAVSDEELLTDDARVLNLLEDNGGRMKQVNIVEETGWSKSKVSMLLSEMEEDGEISKLRVGRENIISIAGEEPEAAGSPFEDQDRDDER